MRYERRVEHRTSAIGELTPETPSVPKTEIAVRGIRGLRGEQLHQNAPLFSLAGRCVDIGLELLLAAVGGVGDVSHTRVGREPGWSERHESIPRNVTRHDPVGRRNV